MLNQSTMSEEISKGSIVVVESRTWPGLNKPGGVARVTAVHFETAASSKKYDVSYVLGGKEKGVEEEYVRLQSSSDDGDETKKKRSSLNNTNNTSSAIAAGGGNLHISTSTASLSLANLSASPLQTPQTNDSSIEESTKKEESPVNDNEEQQVIEERRKRKNSIQEDILMGVSGSRNSSYNSLSGAAKEDKEPDVKKRKMEVEEAETSHDDDDSAVTSSSLHNHHKTAIWSARKHLEIKDKKSSTTTIENDEGASTTTKNDTSLKRWRSHQIAEDYISLASAMVLPPNTTHLNTFGYTPHLGQYPIEQPTALGYLTSSLRRPTVIEKWSPYEIATFEAALALHGKHFHQVQKWVKTKNTKEVIEFYYIWKKTSHYRRWKSSFCEEMESVCSSGSEGEDEMEVVEGKKVE
mmetsp:Transcript_1159/g.1905  ORF Transcript_1159/g.1905 Transcript_1159/m.1905 type:complete len:409 (-) Transcript_1159:46-1272(-)